MPETRPTDYDVVVVGSGAAGLCAALEAADRGASVLVAESEGDLGGSTKLSGGIVMAAETSVQHAAGVADSAQSLCREYTCLNQGSVEPGIAWHLAVNSGPAVEWLISLGVRFLDQIVYAAEESVPRSHVPSRGGAGIVKVLAGAIKERGVDIALGQRISRLIVENGAVCGVFAGTEGVRAGATVLATGGFGANSSLWQQHLPSLTRAGAAAWYIGAAGARGDALTLGAAVDADVTGHDRCLALPTPGFYRNLEVYFPGWLVMVDRSGQRRVDESTSYSTMELAHRRHGPLFALFDDDAKRAAQRGAALQYKQSVPGMEAATQSNWVEPLIDEMVRAGKVVQAQTLAGLAATLSLDAEGLESSVQRYNQAVAAREDVDFRKEVQFLRPVVTPPFYACELRRGVLALTSKGLRIDTSAQVVDRRGRRVPGLYAAGECTGGVLGDVYVGSGNSMASCVVFGRTAGISAARAVLDRTTGGSA
jgi:fumarate reductase flavoprotein subunit